VLAVFPCGLMTVFVEKAVQRYGEFFIPQNFFAFF